MRSLALEAITGKRPYTMEDLTEMVGRGWQIEAANVKWPKLHDETPAARYMKIALKNKRGWKSAPLPIEQAMWKYNRMYFGVIGRPEFLQMLWDARMELVDALNDERQLLRMIPAVAGVRAA